MKASRCCFLNGEVPPSSPVMIYDPNPLLIIAAMNLLILVVLWKAKHPAVAMSYCGAILLFGGLFLLSLELVIAGLLLLVPGGILWYVMIQRPLDEALAAEYERRFQKP